QVERQHVSAVLAAHAVRAAAIKEARGIVRGEERGPESSQHLEADDLAIEERDGPDGYRRERFLDERLVAPLCFLPRLEVRARALGEDAIADDQVGRIPEEVEVREGPLRFLDHHLLEVEDQAHRALL